MGLAQAPRRTRRKQIRIVALDLPTSWQLAAPGDDFTGRMFAAINAMLLDMLAAVARKDYEDRRRRQAQGIAKAKAEGAYRGRPEDTDRNAGIAGMLRSMSLVRHPSRVRLQPRDHRQGRQAPARRITYLRPSGGALAFTGCYRTFFLMLSYGIPCDLRRPAENLWFLAASH